MWKFAWIFDYGSSEGADGSIILKLISPNACEREQITEIIRKQIINDLRMNDFCIALQ